MVNSHKQSGRPVTYLDLNWGTKVIHFSLPVSLDGILQDIRSLERGMEMTKKEFLVQDDSPVLKDFIKTNCEQLESLIKDSKTAQVSQQKL